MADTLWTYDSLAQVDGKTLESILLNGTPPDPEELNGWIYCGWNHEWVGKISGEKFKKGFWKKDGKNFGYNEMCYQNRDKFRGEWKVRMRKNGRPIQLAYFRTSLVKEEQPYKLYERYLHLGHFNYNISLNTAIYNLPFRMIRDFVVLPNPGDHTLMLCKAYFHLLPSCDMFFCYFLLGHRQKIEFFPW